MTLSSLSPTFVILPEPQGHSTKHASSPSPLTPMSINLLLYHAPSLTGTLHPRTSAQNLSNLLLARSKVINKPWRPGSNGFAHCRVTYRSTTSFFEIFIQHSNGKNVFKHCHTVKMKIIFSIYSIYVTLMTYPLQSLLNHTIIMQIKPYTKFNSKYLNCISILILCILFQKISQAQSILHFYCQLTTSSTLLLHLWRNMVVLPPYSHNSLLNQIYASWNYSTFFSKQLHSRQWQEWLTIMLN